MDTKLADFQAMVEREMDRFELRPVWSYEFDRARNRLGQCDYGRRMLSFSRPYVEANEVEIMQNTVLHEIAHALVGAGEGHNEIWEAKAIYVGAKPERCNSDPRIIKPIGPYVFNCKCGSHYFHKLGMYGRELKCKKCDVVNIVCAYYDVDEIVEDEPTEIRDNRVQLFNRFKATLPKGVLQ